MAAPPLTSVHEGYEGHVHRRSIWERQGILHLGVCHSVDIFSLSPSEGDGGGGRIVSHVTKSCVESEREVLISLVTIGADPSTPGIIILQLNQGSLQVAFLNKLHFISRKTSGLKLSAIDIPVGVPGTLKCS